MNIIVDVQGFKNEKNDFIPKEIAILWNKQVFVMHIKSPFPFYCLTKKERIQVTWIEKNRGIHWNEGYIPYANYQNVIGSFFKNKCIFVKGCEKVIWLREMFNCNCVYNLEEKNCPSLVKLYDNYVDSVDNISCLFHDNICALKNVFLLNKWCKENNIL